MADIDIVSATEPDIVDLIREPKTGRFVAGAPSANPRGRPRKGETIAEKVARADAKVARKAITARNKRLTLNNAVGERAWTTYLAYNLGLPKQTFVMERGDDPGMAWLQALAAGGERLAETPYIVEGSSDAT